MIQSKTKKVWLASDGSEHNTREEAQSHDLSKVLLANPTVVGSTESDDAELTAKYIISKSSEVLDILITDGRKRKRIAKAAKKPGKKASEKPQPETTPA